MASLEVIQDCQEALDELKEICEKSHGSYRDLCIKAADSFVKMFEMVDPSNYWKADEGNIRALTKDLKLFANQIKKANELHAARDLG